MNDLTKLFVIYPNPDTSEVSGEFETLRQALSRPATKGAAIIKNGITYAREDRGLWTLVF